MISKSSRSKYNFGKFQVFVNLEKFWGQIVIQKIFGVENVFLKRFGSKV